VTYGILSLLATAGFLFASTRLLVRETKRPEVAPGAAGVTPSTRDAHLNPQQLAGPRKRRLATWLDRKPALWLEVNQVGSRQKTWVRVLTIIFLILLEIGFLYALGENWKSSRSLTDNAERTWAIHAAAAVAFLFMALLGVISMGAAAFRRDNDAKTLEALYATPLSSDDLVYGKFAGVLFSVLPAWLMAQAHAFLAMIMMALQPIAWIWWLLASTTLVFAAAAFAVWVGLRARSLLQANLLAMGGFAVWLIVLPIGLGIMLTVADFRKDGGEIAANVALGWHPIYVALSPFLAGAPDSDFVEDVKGWWMSLVYLIGYGVFTAVLVRSSIPRIFWRVREGFDSERSPFG
jgi:ABC-type transport system involved in multi-copper enzyme maturation permease subunit